MLKRSEINRSIEIARRVFDARARSYLALPATFSPNGWDRSWKS